MREQEEEQQQQEEEEEERRWTKSKFSSLVFSAMTKVNGTNGVDLALE